MYVGMGRHHQDLKIAAPYCTGVLKNPITLLFALKGYPAE
jgi:hypothetical protein